MCTTNLIFADCKHYLCWKVEGVGTNPQREGVSE